MKIAVKLLLFYIFSIGFFLLKFDWISYVIECTCKHDILPKYYALPFIYKCESLGSSMAEVFFISGILLNALAITIPLFMIDFYLCKMFRNLKIWSKIYSFSKIFLFICSLFSFFIAYTFFDNGDFFKWKSDFKEMKKNYNPTCDYYFDGILIP